MGAVFIAASLWMAFASIRTFISQRERESWPEARATVTESAPKKGKNDRTIYDVGYTFDVGAESFRGVLEGRGLPRETGDTFKIKYDPEDPSASTDVLTADRSALTINLTFCILMINLALWANGVPNLFSAIYKLFGLLDKKEESEEKKERKHVSRLRRYMTEGSYPARLCAAAILDSLRLDSHGLPLLIGIFFAIFGIAFWPFYIIGGLCIVFFILAGPVNTISLINKCYRTLGDLEFYRTVQAGLEKKRYPFRTHFRRVMCELCEKAHIE